MRIKTMLATLAICTCTASSFAIARSDPPQPDYSFLQSASRDDGVTLIFLRSKRSRDEVPRIYRNPSPETISAAQREIRTNKRLKAVLVGKRVQLHNVVGIETALNGGKIVYIR